MPIYEFFCPKNRRIYSFFARSLRYAEMTPRCPDNPGWPMEKMVSGFAITGRAREEEAPADPAVGDDARMEAAMAQMEREFGHVAESDNPDPRALAAMMRRMGELSGQRMPEQMDEVIARLERGEDPDRLEQEYGDVFDQMDADTPDAAPEADTARALIRRKRKITRDPTLYEMSEYCEN